MRFTVLCLILAASPLRAAELPVDDDAVIEKMTLEERVGRMLWPVLDERNAERYAPAVRSGHLGGGILRWGMKRGDAKRFIKQLRGWSAESPSAAHFFIAVDHEGGTVFTQPELGIVFPGNMALGAAGSAGLVEKAARASARELRSIGIDVDFAPVVDVNSNPDNPIIGVRSFGEDPTSVAAFAAAAVRGYLSGGVLPSAKHFPGHGDTAQDSHAGLPTVAYGRERWEKFDRPPFQAAVRAGAPMIMTAHVAVPALGTGSLPATLSSAALRGTLRGEMGFDGVIVSDSLDMGAITGTYGADEATARAVAAGCDVLLLGKGDFAARHAALMRAVRDGRITEARLAESVRRIARMEERLNMPLGETADAALLAQRIAEASVTVLKDESKLLPLKPGKAERVAALSFAHPLFGPAFQTFVGELKKRHANTDALLLDGAADKAVSEEAFERARTADVLIVATYQWGSGLKPAQKELLERLYRAGKGFVHISLLNPYEMRHYPSSQTVVLTYGTAPASLRAAVRLLFGEIAPRGRLPVTLQGFHAQPRPSGKQ